MNSNGFFYLKISLLKKSTMNNLTQLNYIFDGRRIYNSGTVSETKAKEILQRVFRDDSAKFYLARPSLFAPYSLSEFIDLVNSDSFINNSILRFVKTK